MRLRSAFFLASAFFVAACEVVTPTNPFDPDTPADQQQPGSLTGTVVLQNPTSTPESLAIELAAIRIRLLDQEGRPVQEGGADVRRELVDLTADRGVFVFDGLVPGGYTVVVDGVSSFYQDAVVVSIDVGAGATADVGDLVFVFDGAGDCGPGSIAGTVDVEDAAAGQRSVSLFVKRADGVRFIDAVVSNDGDFAFNCLSTGTYAIIGESEGFTPDYRVNVEVGEGEGALLAQTFDGEDALRLFPVTAVLLPQNGAGARVGPDGAFVAADAVPLAVLAFGGVSEMRLAADVSFLDVDGNELPFQPYSATFSQPLPLREGPITIFAQFQVRSDDDAFVFTSEAFSTTVVRDVSPPEVLGLSLGDLRDDGGILLADEAALAITVDGQDVVSAIDAVSLDVDGTGADVFDAIVSAGGRVLIPRTRVLARDGEHTVTARLRDRAGNLSAPTAVRVLLDTAAPDVDVVVSNADNGVLHERRAVLTFTDNGGDALLLTLSLIRAGGAEEILGDDDPFLPAVAVALPTPNDAEPITIRATIVDRVGNVAVVDTPTLTLSLRATVRGVVLKAGVPDVEADHGGVAIDVVDATGVVKGSAISAADGSFVVSGVPELAAAFVNASAAGYAPARRSLGVIGAQVPGAPAVDADRLDLALLTGTLVVNARLEEAAADDTAHAGIIVRARLSGGRNFERVDVTGDDGDVRFTGLPATLPGEIYTLTASADRHQPVTTTTDLPAGVVTTAQALRLSAVSGAFDICAGATGACTAASFVNTAQVRVRLRGAIATAIRARAGDPILTTTSEAELPFQPVANAGADVVDIGALADGTVAVFVQFQTGPDATSDVLTASVVKDTVAPSPGTLVVVTAAGALDPRFTAFNNVDVVVDADAGGGTVAPLARARVVVADAAPAVAPAIAGQCDDGRACTIALPTVAGAVVEKLHRLHAFACDQAGNCSGASSTFVIHDRSPPSSGNGASFAIAADDSAVVGGVRVLRSPLYTPSVGTGTARDGGGALVRLDDNANVADVFGYRLSFLSSGVDVPTRALSPTPQPNSTRSDVIAPVLQNVEGDQTVFAVLVDAAGNELTVPLSVTVRIDATAPDAGFALAAVDGNVVATTSDQVRLLVTPGLEAPTRVQLDLDADGAFDDADLAFPFTGGADVQRLISAADGPAVVGARFVDAVGNATTRSASILVDRVAPEVLSLTCTTCRNSGSALFSTASNAQETLNIVANDGAGSGAQAISITVNGGAPTVVQSPSTAAVTLVPNTSNTVVVRSVDRAGNTSATGQSRSLTIVHDNTRPTFAVVVAAGVDVVRSPDVTVAINNASADVVGMRLSSTASFAGPDLPFNPTTTFTLPFPDALRTVFVELTDAAGNRDVRSDDVRLDTVAPNGALIVVNNAGFVTTSTLAVNASLDGATRFALGVEPFSCPTTLAAVPTFPVNQGPLGDGAVTLVGCFGDDAGNVSQNRLTLTVDTQAPIARVALDNGASFSTDLTVDVVVSDAADVVNALFAEGAVNCVTATLSPFDRAVTPTVTLASGAGDGARTVTGCFADRAGNRSSASDTIIVDRVDPSGALVVASGAAFVRGIPGRPTDPVDVNVEVNGASADVVAVAVGVPDVNCATAAYQAFSPLLRTSLNVDGNTTVAACLKDLAGRTAKITDTVVLDRVPPAGAVVLNAGAATVTSLSVSGSFVVDADVTAVALVPGDVECEGLVGSDFVAISALSPPLTKQVTLLGGGPQTATACFRDAADNRRRASDSIEVDLSALDQVEVVAGNGAAFSRSANVVLTVLAPSDATTSKVFVDASAIDGNANNIVDVCEPAAGYTAFNATPTVPGLANGVRTLGVCVKTASGRTLFDSDTIEVDTVFPVGTLSINGGAARTKNEVALIDLTFSADVDAIAVTNAASIDCNTASFEPAAATKSILLPGPDTEASNTIRACLRDRAGNTTVVSSSIIFDRLPPQGIAAAIVDDTSSPAPSAGFVHKTAVKARLTLGTGTTQIAVAEGGLDCDAATFVNAAGATVDVNLTLSSGDATKSITACFKDVVGNISSATASTVLDTANPVGRAILANGAATTASRLNVGIALDAPSDVRLASIVEAATLNCATATYQAFVQNGVLNLSAGDATKTVSVCLKDDSGRTFLAQDSIILDETRPVGTLTLTGNGQTGFTNSLQIGAAIASADAVEMAISTAVLDCDNTAYAAFATTTALTLPSGDGAKSVNLCLRDIAGNRSLLISSSITLDQTPPAAAAHTVAVNGGAAFSTSSTTALTINFAADAVERAIGNDGLDCTSATYAALPATSPQTVAGFVVSAGDGVKVVAVCFRDRAKNTTLATDTITLDTAAPSTLDTALTINAGAARVPSTTLSLTLQVPNDVDGVAYQEGALSQAACDALSTFEVPTSPRVFVLASSTEGLKTVSACVRERAGRRIVVADNVFLDPNRPTLTTLTLEGLASGGFSRDRVVDVAVIGASADSVAMAVADAAIADCAAAAYVPFSATFTRTLLATDGLKTVAVCLRDETGNTSATSTTATITLDSAPPAGVAIDVPTTSIASTVSATLTYAATGAGAATAVAVAEGAIDCSTATRSALDGVSPDNRNVVLGVGDGSKSVVACFYDDAGNFTAAVPDSVVVDSRAPVVSSVVCANCTVDGGVSFLASATATLAIVNDEAGSGVGANALVSVDGGADTARAFAGGVVSVPALATGLHTLRVRLQDVSGNITAVSDAKTISVTVDTTPPALVQNTDFRINGANSGTSTSSTSVNVTVLNPAADATQMAIAEGALNCATASYVPLVTAFTFNLAGAAQTTRTLNLCMKDRAGNNTAAPQTASVTFDTVPPALPGSNVVVIDNADPDNNANAFLTTTAGLRILLDWNTAGDVVAFKVNEAFADCSEPMERPATILTIDSFVKTDFVMSSVDGNHVVFACFRDAAGNTVVSSAAAVLDQVGANGALVINGGNAFVTSVAEDVSVVLRMGEDTARFALAETVNAACTTPTLNCAAASYVNVAGASVVDGALQQTVSQNLNGAPAAQGGKCFEACFEDVAGNRTATASLDGITFDTVPPAATATLAGLSLTPGLTRSPFVTLTLTGAPADAAQMRLSEDSGFLGGTVPFEAFAATRAVALSPNDGGKTINVQLRDTAGNTSVLAINAGITLDTVAPSGTAVAINSGAAATSNATVALFAQATGAAERLILTPDNPVDVEAFAAFPVSPTTLSGVVIENGVTGADDGGKTVLVIFRDAAGNESAAAVDTIDLDRAAPAPATVACGVGTATGVCINNGASATNSVSASLGLAASGASEMQIAADGCADTEAFVSLATATTVLLDGSTQGAKVVAARFRDAAGNLSQSFTNCAATPGHTASIAFDSIAPSAVSVALTSTNATDPAGFTTTALANGTFTRGDATSFKHGQAVDCSTAAGYAVISGVSATVNNIALAGGAGFKSYFACFKDDAGNVTSATTSITVDNQVPAGTVLLAGGATTIGSSTTTATLTFSNDTTGVLVQATNPGTCPAAAGSYQAAQSSLPITLTAGSGNRSAFACLRDAAGNVSSVLSDAVDVDVTPPGLSITVNASATSPITTNSTTVTLGVNASDTNGPVTMSVSNTTLNCATANYTTLSASLQHQIPVSASTTINVCAKDGLGVTTVSPATFLVNLDQTGPAGTAEVRSAAGVVTELVNTTAVVVRLNLTVGEAGVTRKLVNDSADCANPAGYAALEAVLPANVAHTLSTGDGTTTVFVCYKDSVGNVSVVSDTVVLDTTPPSATLALNNGATVSLSTTVTANFANVIDVAQTRFFTVDPGTCPAPFAGYGAFVNGGNQTVSAPSTTVFACLADAAGNTTKISDAIDVDVVDPTIANFTIVSNAPDATFTSTRSVTLSINRADLAADVVAFAVENTSITCSTASYEPLPQPIPATFTRAFELSTGVDGSRNVAVCVKDAAGRTNAGLTRSINLDTSPPQLTTFRINSGNAITNDPNLTVGLVSSPGTDPLRVVFATDPATVCAQAAFTGLHAALPATRTVNLSPGDGTRFVVGCFQDRAGNVSGFADDIVLDTVSPGGFVAECATCNIVAGVGFTNTADFIGVSIADATAVDVVSALSVVSQDDVEPLAQNRTCTVPADCRGGETCALFPTSNSPLTLTNRCVQVHPDLTNIFVALATAASPINAAPATPAQGVQKMSLALVDAAGNISRARAFSVVRDVTAPTITWALNASSVTNATTVFVRSLTATNEASFAGVAQLGTFQASSLTTFADSSPLGYTAAQSSDAFPLTLSAGDGVKTVAVRFVDNAGNINNTALTQVNITLDTTPPADPRLNASSTTINGALALAALLVQSTDSVGLRSPPYDLILPITSGATCPPGTTFAGGAGCQWNGTTPLSIPASAFREGENRVRVAAFDSAGNRSNEDAVTVTFDSVRPTVTGVVAEPGNEELTVRWVPTDPADVDHYEVFYGPIDGGSNAAQYTGLNADQGASPVLVSATERLRLTGLPNGTPVFVAVRAVDNVGPGALTPAADSVVPNDTPLVFAANVAIPGVGRARSVAFADGLAFVVFGCNNVASCTSSGVGAFDLSDPSSPTLLGSLTSTTGTFANALDIKILGDRAYIADGPTVRVVNISDPTAMTLQTTINMPNLVAGTDFAMAVAVRPGLLAVAAESEGVLFYNITSTAGTPPSSPTSTYNPACPSAECIFRAEGRAISIDLQGQFAYVGVAGLPLSDFPNRSVEVIDITTLATPVRSGTGAFTTLAAWDIEAHGGLIYLAQNSTVRVHSVPTGVVTVDQTTSNTVAEGSGQPRSIAVAGPLVFVADDESFSILAYRADTFSASALTKQMPIVGQVATSGSGFRSICDIGGGVLTTRTGSACNRTAGGQGRLVVANNLLLEANDSVGLRVFRIGQPVRAREVGHISVDAGGNFGAGENGAGAIGLNGRTVLLPGRQGLAMYRINNPASPLLLDSVNTDSIQHRVLTQVNDTIYVAGASSMIVYRYTAGTTGTLKLTNTEGRLAEVATINYGVVKAANAVAIRWPFAYVLVATNGGEASTGNTLRVLNLITNVDTGVSLAVPDGAGFRDASMAYHRNRLYITRSTGTTVAVTNITTRTAPAAATTFANTNSSGNPTSASGLWVQGTQLFVGSGITGLSIFDLASSLTTPTKLGNATVGGAVLVASGNHVFSGSQPSVTIVDVLDPTAPLAVALPGRLRLEQAVLSVGKHVFVQDRDELSVVELQ